MVNENVKTSLRISPNRTSEEWKLRLEEQRRNLNDFIKKGCPLSSNFWKSTDEIDARMTSRMSEEIKKGVEEKWKKERKELLEELVKEYEEIVNYLETTPKEVVEKEVFGDKKNYFSIIMLVLFVSVLIIVHRNRD